MRQLFTGAAVAAMALLALTACSKKAGDGAAAGAAAPAEASGGISGGGKAAAIRPKPGKWRMTTTSTDLPAGMPALPAVDVCITPDMVADDHWAVGPNGKPETCSEFKVTTAGGVVKTHAVCSSDGITTTIDSTISGDFSKRYTAETVMSSAPALPGAPNPMRMKATMERVGDC